jgi:hypothetical protein
MTERIICCNCDNECTPRYLMCDKDNGEFCPDCFDLTACAAGVHGEGCSTLVINDRALEACP